MNAAGPRRLLRSTVRVRRREFERLTGWSLVQAVPALLSGWLVARAVDDGFLADRTVVGFGWLGLLACAVLIGAWGTRQATLRLSEVVEPFRDELAALVTTGTLRGSARLERPADTAGVARLTEQVEVARESYGAVVMFAQTFAVTVVSVLLGLAALDPALLLFVMPPLAAGLAVFLLALRALAARQRAVVLADEAVTEHVSTAVGGLRDVTACGAEGVVRGRTGARIEAAAAASRALARLAALRTLALALGGWLPVVLILAGAPWLIRGGVTAGAILGALTYVSQGLQPALQGFVTAVGGSGLWLLVTVGRILETATAAPTRAPETATVGRARRPRPEDHVVPSHPPDDQPAADRPPAPHDGGIELCGVTFGYARSADPVVRKLDLTLAPGTHLAVVGPSGVGKSTLASLIAGVLEPQAGRVRLGGVPVRSLEPGRLSRSRVLIPQEAYVFSGTLRENLAYLHPTATPYDLDTAVDAIGAGPLTERLGGYEASVDPALLSAGERQLIALVRAWLPAASLVVLDEATCHLDPAAEAVAEQAFAARPATLVVCAHRISSALRADLVLVMDGPRCRVGTHDRLLTDCALYRDLIGHWDHSATKTPP
ncbi:ABC transporter ATP-binding protein/permease [Streptomyces sp. NBC_00104]|uniref:ATP-binding cassette domain-containing protein n=1 Tax=unclassified Streptomyces TaxID=2593676 RepID=UPI003244381E